MMVLLVEYEYSLAPLRLSYLLVEFEGGILQVLNHFQQQGIYDPMRDMVLSPFNKISTNGSISAQG